MWTTITSGAPSTAPVATAQPEPAAPAAVLGLDADDPGRGIEFTLALRRAFANEGLSGGTVATLAELRLVLECDTVDLVCLAKGGAMLDARRLIYGTLQRVENGGWMLSLSILEAESATIFAAAQMALSEDDLGGGNIDATAARVVDQMLGEPEASGAPLPRRSARMSQAQPAKPADSKSAAPRGFWFGLERPTPRWKWAAFGTSLGLTTIAISSTVGMAVWLTSYRGGFRRKLVRLAEDSLNDSNEFNDVDPSGGAGANLCDEAETTRVGPNGPSVTNGLIAQHCRNASDVQRVQLGTGIATLVFGVTTLVFTGLLVVHRGKRPPKTERDRRLSLGAAPNLRGGGATVQLGARF